MTQPTELAGERVTKTQKLCFAGQPPIERVVQTIQGATMITRGSSTANTYGGGWSEAAKHVGLGSNLPPSMDPNYSTHKGLYPCPEQPTIPPEAAG